MGMSDRIESFILELLKEDDEWLELGRNELASVFNCVPSQINYVISTRFNADRGYLVESKRGGGGYLRIKKLNYSGDDLIFNTLSKIGNSIDFPTTKSQLLYLMSAGVIDEKTNSLILSATCEKSIPSTLLQKDIIRANILKNMLITLL